MTELFSCEVEGDQVSEAIRTGVICKLKELSVRFVRRLFVGIPHLGRPDDSIRATPVKLTNAVIFAVPDGIRTLTPIQAP